MGIHHNSVSASILRRIRRHGRGWVFTSEEFGDLGGQAAVTSTLKRLHQNGEIRRLDRGLYDYPRQHPELGLLAPRPEDVAKAVVGKSARLQPSGAYALNLLGLSPQVPMKIVYLTDDFTRTVQIGRQEIILKGTTPKNMATAGRTSGLVIQALRHLGREQVNEETIAHLKNVLSAEDRKSLLKDVQYAPAWIAAVIRRLAE